MGLDMYAFSVPKEDYIDELSYESSEEYEPKSLAYWRKHYRLHEWMRNLFFSKGGQDVFNVKPVHLTAEDLDKLEYDLNNGLLPYEYMQDITPIAHSLHSDLDFVKLARDEIKSGREVYYDSWW